MSVFLLRRFVILVLTLILVSALAFLVPYLSEGDPVRSIMRARVSDLAIDPASIESLRRHLGLDRPLTVQYLDWLWNAARGDLGYSFTSRAAVGPQIANALGVSATLALSALLLALAAAIPLGTIAALKPGRGADNAVTFLTQSSIAVPEYWLAPLGILVFAIWLGWLPSAGWREWESLVLPSAVLAVRPFAYLTRITRATMIEVLRAPYMTAARSRGLSMRAAILRHGTRNGLPPIMTLLAMWLAGLLGGSVVVEVIFAIPGMGRLVFDAVINKDTPILQGGMVCIVALSVIISTLTDLLYALANPAVRADNVAH
jgi:peptide/nickel transport system permease protein